MDFIVAAEDRDAAAEALRAGRSHGRATARGLVVQGLLGRRDGRRAAALNGRDVDAATLARATEREVLSVVMPVSDVTDVLVAKLCALNEQQADLGKVLPVARAVREQVDWAQVAREIGAHDVAVACLYLLRRLGVASDGDGVSEVLHLAH